MKIIPKLNEIPKEKIFHQLKIGDIDIDFLVDYIYQINHTYNILVDYINIQDKQKEEAINYLNNHWTGGYTDSTCKYKVEEINITELLNILGENEESKI